MAFHSFFFAQTQKPIFSLSDQKWAHYHLPPDAPLLLQRQERMKANGNEYDRNYSPLF